VLQVTMLIFYSNKIDADAWFEAINKE